MRTLLIALLFSFPVLGDAADDWPASNWIWELPPERQFTGLLTDAQFRKVVLELERRDEGRRVVTFRALNPSNQVVAPSRRGNGIEAAEIFNSLRMDRYREQCENLKHSQLQGTPAVYPRQIPFLQSR